MTPYMWGEDIAHAIRSNLGVRTGPFNRCEPVIGELPEPGPVNEYIYYADLTNPLTSNSTLDTHE